MPSLDVFAGKQIDWDAFAANPDFYQKNFDLRYDKSGVVIMKRKGNQGQQRKLQS